MAADDKYKDIINLPYEKSNRHPQMPPEARAAQFAPFAALSGFEEKIESTRREFEENELAKE